MCRRGKARESRAGKSHAPVEPLLYRPGEAAEALGVSRSQVYVLMNRGEIPWVVLGGVRRVPVEPLLELIRTKTVEGTRRGAVRESISAPFGRTTGRARDGMEHGAIVPKSAGA